MRRRRKRPRSARLARERGLRRAASPARGTTEFQDVLVLEPTAAEQSTPLGGPALALRKQEMQRAHRDMLHFHTTLESLQQRKDRNGLMLFSQFLDAYMGMHLDPLLAERVAEPPPRADGARREPASGEGRGADPDALAAARAGRDRRAAEALRRARGHAGRVPDRQAGNAARRAAAGWASGSGAAERRDSNRSDRGEAR